MKLVRWGEAGAEQAGLVDASGTLRDLSSAVADWSWQTLTPETLAQVAALDTEALPELPSRYASGRSGISPRQDRRLRADLWQARCRSRDGSP